MTEKVKQAYNSLSIRKRLLLIVVFSLIVFAIAGTVAIGYVSGFSSQSPANQSTVTTATPQISAHLSNSGGTYDVNNIEMSIDNNTPFKPMVGGTSPEYNITYTPTTSLSDGVHSVLINVPDSANPGTPYSTNWSFTVAAPPVLSSFSPVNTTITNRTPVISAIAKDNTGIGSAILKLDGQAYSPQIDHTTGKISYTPSIPLLDGNHSVNLTVYDTSGNSRNIEWYFSIDATGPSLSLQPGDNVTINTLGNQNRLLVQAKDASNIDQNSVQLFINGSPTPFNFRYYVDQYGDEYYDQAFIDGPVLSDGIYTARVVVKDGLGNVSDRTWHFTIAIPPTVTSISPADKSIVTTPEIDIAADISDPTGPAIDQNNIKLTLDGIEQTFTYTASDSMNGKLTAKVAGLQPEQYNNFSLVIPDTVGGTTTYNWKVYYNKFGEMPAQASDCGSCHALNQYNKYVHSRGPDLETSGGTAGHGETGTCGHCHRVEYVPDKCDYCHGGPPEQIYYGSVQADPSLQANRNCLDCHGVNGPMVEKVNNSVDPAPEGTKHDILPLHQGATSDCTSCHSGYLTRTHNGKKDKAGNEINCATCHKSTNQKVKDAIATHKKDCLACHDLASNHEAVHTDTLDAYCLRCHKSTLTTEHTSNPITQKTKLDCHSCHDSTRADVSAAIYNSNKDCSACHDNAHGLPLSGTLPTDVPTNPSYNWTAPIKGAIFSGEPWFPSEYKDGHIIISNRRTDISGDQAWNYYSTQMQSLGWALASDAPTAGSTYFKVNFTKVDSFTKVTRKATIWFYGGDNHNDAPVSTAGSRIEIFYN